MSQIPGLNNHFGTAQALQYGAQTTVDAASVSPLCAGVANVNVTSTSATGIVSYTPPEDGIFDLRAYASINNGTSGATITLSATYTDLQTDASKTVYFTTGATVLNAAASVANGVYPCAAFTIPVKGGTTISISYTDASATPNDYITALISQVA